jgi:serine protease Do
MKLVKVAGVLVALAGIGVLGLVAAPALYTSLHAAQDRGGDSPERRARERLLDLRGPVLGMTVRDMDASELAKQKLQSGVVVDDVEPGTAAEKAGLKRGDVIVQFDGEAVHSARQFTRLVREAAAGRSVKASVVRDGHRSDVQVTPEERGGDMLTGELGDYMREFGRQMGTLGDRLPPLSFDFDWPAAMPRRLGVTVQELTPQLADYFGAHDGVLVTSVAEGSAAERGGLKAGDVITAVNGSAVGSRGDLVRSLRDAHADEDVTLAVVRNRQTTTVKVRLEARRMTRGRLLD